MRVIIAGSRDITDYKQVEAAYLSSNIPITEIVSGGARGVDALGEQVAKNFGIPIKVFPADWDKHGKRAGPLRNIQMAEYADGLIAIWDGKSIGTKHMIDQANKQGLVVYIFKGNE